MGRSLITLAILLVPCAAMAGNRHHCNQLVAYHHQAVAVVQKVVLPTYYATVSPGLAEEAQVRAWARDEYRQQEQLKAQTLQQTAPTGSLVSQKCMKCHGTDGSGPDFTNGMTDHFKVRWLEMLGQSKDIPDEMKALVAKAQSDGSGPDLTNEVLKLPTVEQPVAKEEGRLE
jgi:mono/diheme cytochrome c family protein